MPEYDQVDDSISHDEPFVFCQPRWTRSGTRYPVWADTPKSCFERGLIPINLLRPEEIGTEVDVWILSSIAFLRPEKGAENFEEAFEHFSETKENLRKIITRFREIVTHFNLPYLSLPVTTPKETALRVFVNMNTNSKPLSLYDIIVAEVESVKGESLHDLQKNLEEVHPTLHHYGDVSHMILAAAALLQDKTPSERGMVEMDKALMVENWSVIERCLGLMAKFLENQKIYDAQRLPTNAIISVIAALFSFIPDTGDARGRAEKTLKQYMWHSFFTDRYENSAASRAIADYKALKGLITQKKKEDGKPFQPKDVPVLNHDEYPLPVPEELITVGWPKQQNILGRGILAVSTYLGAWDFADGCEITPENIGKREYHHIFPDALLQEAEEKSYLALNCSLITGNTNREIGRKDPLDYLKDRYEWTDEYTNTAAS